MDYTAIYHKGGHLGAIVVLPVSTSALRPEEA